MFCHDEAVVASVRVAMIASTIFLIVNLLCSVVALSAVLYRRRRTLSFIPNFFNFLFGHPQ